MTLSVIIPLAADETEYAALVQSLPEGAEVILSQEGSRARSLNAGAMKATGEYLWFLHADSRLDTRSIGKLYEAIARDPNALLYFDLAYLNDATPLMALNARGANFRSRAFGIPFGDQGFCIKKDLYMRLGGFPEDATYGEDHLFVWRARRGGIPIRPVGATLYTSARKYRDRGWLRITMLHQYLWIRQAWPEWKILRKARSI